MLTAYERKLLTSYLANIASGLKRRDPEARELIDWIADRDNHIALGAKRRHRRRHLKTGIWKKKKSSTRRSCAASRRPSGRNARTFRRDGTAPPCASGGSGKMAGPQSNRSRHPQTAAALRDPRSVRVHDRRHFRGSRAIHECAQSAWLGGVLDSRIDGKRRSSPACRMARLWSAPASSRWTTTATWQPRPGSAASPPPLATGASMSPVCFWTSRRRPTSNGATSSHIAADRDHVEKTAEGCAGQQRQGQASTSCSTGRPAPARRNSARHSLPGSARPSTASAKPTMTATSLRAGRGSRNSGWHSA